jgi:hypothetical protein
MEIHKVCGNQECKSVDKKSLSLCGRCLNVSYCCRECQLVSWSSHKKICIKKSTNINTIYTDFNDEELFKTFTNLLLSNKPVWIARYGGSDTDVYETIKKTNSITTEMISSISKFNGFFCKDTNLIVNVFTQSRNEYYKSLKNSDFITICTSQRINEIIEKNNNPFIDKQISSYSFIEGFDPFFKSFQIWGENKKILIISPFSKSIKYQTSPDRINKILVDSYKFPNCLFTTYQTPITYNTNGCNSNYFKRVTDGCNSWLDISEKICNEIKELDFDIAFISAGIYTMSVGNFIKQIGKKAIYIGGMLNVLFNIYGSRYDTTFFNSFMNKEYQIDVMDSFDDLIDNKSLYVKNEVLGAYMRNKIA